MGMELRIREPSAEGVAPSRLDVAPNPGLLSPDPACRAGVSNTSLRNCELFIVVVVRQVLEFEVRDLQNFEMQPCARLVDFSAGLNSSD
jgi:hypothetical protein